MLCVVEIVIRIQMIAKKTSQQDFLSLEEDDLFSSLPKKKIKSELWFYGEKNEMGRMNDFEKVLF